MQAHSGDVVRPPEKLRIGRKWSRVDGWDQPGHDGEGSLNGVACAYLSAYRDEPGHDRKGSVPPQIVLILFFWDKARYAMVFFGAAVKTVISVGNRRRFRTGGHEKVWNDTFGLDLL
jgi:hypothetical protein